VVSKASGSLGNGTLLQSPFDEVQDERATDDLPAGWMHDGTRPSMARIVKFGQDPQTKAFAVVDEDPASHAEWHNIFESAPPVKPGDNLVVEWNEMYSMDPEIFGRPLMANCHGQYTFHVRDSM